MSAAAKGQPVAKVKGRQLVGSQEIEVDGDSEEGERRRSKGGYDDEGEMDGMRDSDDGDRVRGTDSDEDLSGSDIDSARERANESKLTIDTKKSAEPEREIGDQKTIDIEGGPIFDQKIAVDDRLFMARVAEQGGRHEEAIEFLIDFFRKKDE